jgi:hypothetical protein
MDEGVGIKIVPPIGCSTSETSIESLTPSNGNEVSVLSLLARQTTRMATDSNLERDAATGHLLQIPSLVP